MPYASKAQQRWAHTPKGTKALGGADKVKEWDGATKASGGFKRLPDHAVKTAVQMARKRRKK